MNETYTFDRSYQLFRVDENLMTNRVTLKELNTLAEKIIRLEAKYKNLNDHVSETFGGKCEQCVNHSESDIQWRDNKIKELESQIESAISFKSITTTLFKKIDNDYVNYSVIDFMNDLKKELEN